MSITCGGSPPVVDTGVCFLASCFHDEEVRDADTITRSSGVKKQHGRVREKRATALGSHAYRPTPRILCLDCSYVANHSSVGQRRRLVCEAKRQHAPSQQHFCEASCVPTPSCFVSYETTSRSSTASLLGNIRQRQEPTVRGHSENQASYRTAVRLLLIIASRGFRASGELGMRIGQGIPTYWQPVFTIYIVLSISDIGVC